MIRRPPRSTPLYSSAASDVYKRQPWPIPGAALICRNDGKRSVPCPADVARVHLISNSRYTSAFPRREAPEVCVSLSLKQEGAGNAGCALHPRSRVQRVEKKMHTSI